MKRWKKLSCILVACTLLGAQVIAEPSSSPSSPSYMYPSCQPEYSSFNHLMFAMFMQSMAQYALMGAPVPLSALFNEASVELLFTSYEPSAGGTEWFFDAGTSYRVRESHVAERVFGQDAHIRTWKVDMNANMVSDRWSLGINVPYSIWRTNGSYSGLNGESIGLNLVPQYLVLREDSEVCDMSVFALGGYEHVWFNNDVGVDDMDFVTWGVGTMVGKTFEFGRVSLAYGFEAKKNIDGDDLVTGNGSLKTQSAALTYGFALTENLYGSVQGLWEHTRGLPSVFDSSAYTGRATLGYVNDRWTVETGYARTLSSKNFRDYEVELTVGYRW